MSAWKKVDLAPSREADSKQVHPEPMPDALISRHVMEHPLDRDKVIVTELWDKKHPKFPFDRAYINSLEGDVHSRQYEMRVPGK